MAKQMLVDNNKNEEITLKELILKVKECGSYVLHKWVTVLLFAAIGAGLGFAYSYLKKDTFSAITTFVLEGGDSRGGLGQYSGLASMVGIDVGGGSGGGIFQGDNIIELYKSRTMIEKTLLSEVSINGEKQLLIERYQKNIRKKNFVPAENLFDAPHLKDESKQRLRDSILAIVVSDINRNYLSVSKPDKKLSIIKVEVKAKDELFAKSFNDILVENVNSFYVRTTTKKSKENVDILHTKVDSVQRLMNTAIYTAAAVADETPNINPARQAKRVVPIQRSQFSTETNKVVLGELIKNLEVAKISLLKETPLIQVIDHPIYPLEVQKSSALQGMFIGAFIFSVLIMLILVFIKIINDQLS